MRTYAFIPARGNSKRVPGKNIKLLNGEPLIYYTIKAALESLVDRIYFTTEDRVLAETANDIAFRLDKTGARFDILLRNPKLSQDHVQNDETVLDAFRTVEMIQGIPQPDSIMLLQPTSPLRTRDDINGAIKQWNESDMRGTLISGYTLDGFVWNNGKEMTPMGHNPERRLGKQWIKDYFPVMENGAIYITNAEQFSLYRTVRVAPYQFYEMDARKSVDIDYPRDFQRAAELLNFV